MGESVLPHGQNLLEILKKYNNEPHMFLKKVGQFFQYGSSRIVPNSNFSKDA